MGAHGSFAFLTWSLAVLSACGGTDLTLPGPGGLGDLIVVSGDRQQGQIGKRLDKPLVVQVNDGQGQPAQGAEVAFAGSAGSPAVNPVSATTDGKGQALTRVTLGDAEGPQTVEAQLAGASTKVSVLFHVTAMAPRDTAGQGGGGGGGGDHQGNGNCNGGGGDGHGD